MNPQQSPAIANILKRPFGATVDPAKQVSTRPPVARTPEQSPLANVGSSGASPPAVPRPQGPLGDSATWRPSLQSSTSLTGVPVYDNASVARLQARNAAGTLTRPDLSNVTTGAPAPAISQPTRTPAPTRPASAPLETDYTRPAPPDPASPPVIVRPSAVPQLQQAIGRAVDAQRGQTLTARADASALLNPMSNSAELMRRLENSQNSYFNKGSPQARRLIGEAIAGQLGAQAAASSQGQRAGSETLAHGVGHEAGALEGAARRQVDTDMFNADDSYRTRALAEQAATRRAEIERPSLQTAADGRLLRVTGATAAPVLDPGGSPVSVARPEAPRDHQAAADDRMLAELLGLQKDDYGEYPADAIENAQRQLAAIRAGQRGGSAQTSPAAPTAGDVLDGYRFRGGDPSDRANWEAE